MNLFNDFIKLDIKKNMGLYNLTDEFFCVYLNSVRLKNKNILVVVDTIFEANKLYNNLSLLCDDVYLFPMDDFLTSEALAVSPDLMIKRLETINSIVFQFYHYRFCGACGNSVHYKPLCVKSARK